MKKCRVCEVEKEESKFSRWRNICMSCKSKAYKERVKNKENKLIPKIKICKNCGKIKNIEDFYTLISSTDGHCKKCKECSSLESKLKYQKYKERYSKKSNENYYKSKESRNEERLAVRREYTKLKRQIDPKYLLKRRLRNRLYYALKNKGWKKNTHFNKYIGCSYEELVEHIESQFKDGMTWENRSSWHIDHIIALDKAQNEEELYRLCHHSNLQPMWARDNIKKGNK